jgi:hypothetical protein
LAALRAAVHGGAGPTQALHKPLLDIARKYPVLANVNHHIVGRHFPTSTCMSVLGDKNRQAGSDLWLKKIFSGIGM